MSLAPKRAGNFPQPIPRTRPASPRACAMRFLVAPFNDLETVASPSRAQERSCWHHRRAVQRLIPPKPGFLEGLRKLTQENSLILIFDEVVTGFRFAYGRRPGYYGVTAGRVHPWGKAIGGGFPLAAIRRAPPTSWPTSTRALSARTPLCCRSARSPAIRSPRAAGLKTLEILKRPGAYERIFKTGRALMEGYAEILKTRPRQGPRGRRRAHVRRRIHGPRGARLPLRLGDEVAVKRLQRAAARPRHPEGRKASTTSRSPTPTTTLPSRSTPSPPPSPIAEARGPREPVGATSEKEPDGLMRVAFDHRRNLHRLRAGRTSELASCASIR